MGHAAEYLFKSRSASSTSSRGTGSTCAMSCQCLNLNLEILPVRARCPVQNVCCTQAYVSVCGLQVCARTCGIPYACAHPISSMRVFYIYIFICFSNIYIYIGWSRRVDDESSSRMPRSPHTRRPQCPLNRRFLSPRLVCIT